MHLCSGSMCGGMRADTDAAAVIISRMEKILERKTGVQMLAVGDNNWLIN